jgi:tRNA A-37 threonylcarbamoyl transferase component Bud32
MSSQRQPFLQPALQDVKVSGTGLGRDPVTYIPVPREYVTKTQTSCTQYLRNFTADEKMAEGGWGSIKKVCLDPQYSNCPYVAKIQKLKGDKGYRNFSLEVALTRAAAERKFGIPILDAWTCDNRLTGVMILEKWDGDVGTMETISERDLRNLLRVVRDMHDSGIFHNDLYAKNILYKRKRSLTFFAITDFGVAFLVADPIPPLIKAIDIATLFYGFTSETEGPLYCSFRDQLTNIQRRARANNPDNDGDLVAYCWQLFSDYVSDDQLLDLAVAWRVNQSGNWQGHDVTSEPIKTNPFLLYQYMLRNLPWPLFEYLGPDAVMQRCIWLYVNNSPQESEQEIDDLIDRMWSDQTSSDRDWVATSSPDQSPGSSPDQGSSPSPDPSPPPKRNNPYWWKNPNNQTLPYTQDEVREMRQRAQRILQQQP